MTAKGKDKRKLPFTSIIEDITQLRNDAIDSMIDAASAKEDKVDFGIEVKKKVGNNPMLISGTHCPR